MTMVVTGAAGFIGSHLVEALASRGYDVTGIDRRPDIAASAHAAIVADLTKGTRGVREAIARADAVWHLAGLPGVRGSDPDLDRRRHTDNVVAGDRVLRATPADVPLVVVSSSSVYGGARHGGRLRPSREDDVLRPRGGYAHSKAMLEMLARRRARSGGWVAVARPFTVAGERQRPDMAIARWIEQARGGLPISVFGSPRRTRDVTDVRDVIEGLIRIVERGAQGTFNLGSGVRRTLAEIADAVGESLDTELVLEFRPAGEEDVEVTWACIDRAREVLDYEPNTDLPSIVRRQAAVEALV